METKIDLIPSDISYNVRREHGCQTSGYDSFSKDDISEKFKISCDYLKLVCIAHIFYSAVFLSWVKAFSDPTGSVAIEDAEGSERKRKEAMFHQEKQWMVQVRHQRNFIRNLGGDDTIKLVWKSML